jgi:uncharacterized RDD family membrane protein YckC
VVVSPFVGERNERLTPGGLGRRLGARIADGLFLALVCYLPATRGPGLPEYVIGYVGAMVGLGIRTSDLWGLDRRSLSRFAGGAAFVLGCLAYFTLCEARGQTLGKRMFGVRVIRADGGRFVTHGQALIRSLAFVVTSLPLGLGQLAMLWDPHLRSWSDRVAGTRVVRVGWSGRVESLAWPVLATAALSAILSVGVPFALLVAPLRTILHL